MVEEHWLETLYSLANRFNDAGVSADIPALDLCELCGLYCFLSRLEQESNGEA